MIKLLPYILKIFNGIEIKKLLMARTCKFKYTYDDLSNGEEESESMETLHTHVICVHTFPKFAIKRKKRVFKYIGITLDDNYFQHYFLKSLFRDAK